MAKKFRDLRARMSPEHQKRAHERAQEVLAEMPLQELRQAGISRRRRWPARCAQTKRSFPNSSAGLTCM